MQSEADVIVVGAGPVGLAAAIELGSRGIKVLLRERNTRGGAAPRAKTTNVRTRTHLRRWGIADQLAAASPMGVDYPSDVKFVTSLAGYPHATLDHLASMAPERSTRYPEHALWIPQYTLERVMLEHARTLPAIDICFGSSLITAEQDGNAVRATFSLASGEQEIVEASYLIGADGARSRVRETIGATMEGRHNLSRHYNIIFRAPGLANAHCHGPANMYWQISPKGLSVIGPMDRNDTWFFMPAGVPEGIEFSAEQARERIAAATGINLPYEILSADQWTASELIASVYHRGQIFLAGDACHLHPPFGGYGMNMGVGDGVDLGWKMAASLQGWGSPTILESYEAERRPVHRAVMDEALANYSIVGGPPAWPRELEDASPEGTAARERVGSAIQASKAREFYTLGTVLGLAYKSSPIIAQEAGPWPTHDSQVYTPSSRPGCLAPHVWLEDGRSLYDLFSEGFSLVVQQGAAESDVAEAEGEASTLNAPLTVIRCSEVSQSGLFDAALTLVRPDQYVAWRGSAWNGALKRAAGW